MLLIYAHLPRVCYQDLRELLDSVRDSDVLVIVQSAEVLSRPWCLLEIVAALDACLLTEKEMQLYRSFQDDADGCAAAFPNNMQVHTASSAGEQCCDEHDP